MNQIQTILRGVLYVVGVALLGGGLAFFISPEIVTANFDLSPLSIKGTAEIRALYGGGFFSFGLMTLLGLRHKNLGPGLLMAMAIFMWTLGYARVLVLWIDTEFALTVPAMVAEFIVGYVYWTCSKHSDAYH